MHYKLSRTRFVRFSALSLVAVAVLCTPHVTSDDRPGGRDIWHRRARLAIDVACDFNTIRFDGPTQKNPNDPADPNDHPDYGAHFVVQGVIYPAGTFERFGANSGLLADGEPEFPDLVIGRWTCRGWFTGDRGIFTESGPFVTTTQLYDLDLDRPGAQTIVSDGLELIDFDVPFSRAITGGTGRYRHARGEVEQTAIGANATGLFNFTFRFRTR